MQPRNKAILSWRLYDWANSAFRTVIGAFVLGAAISAIGSQRAGMAVTIVLIAAGLALLLPVREPRPSA